MLLSVLVGCLFFSHVQCDYCDEILESPVFTSVCSSKSVDINEFLGGNPLKIMAAVAVSGTFRGENTETNFNVPGTLYIIRFCLDDSQNPHICDLKGMQNLHRLCLRIGPWTLDTGSMVWLGKTKNNTLKSSNAGEWNSLADTDFQLFSRVFEHNGWFSPKVIQFVWANLRYGMWMEQQIAFASAGYNNIVSALLANNQLVDSFHFEVDVRTTSCTTFPAVFFAANPAYQIRTFAKARFNNHLLVRQNPHRCRVVDWLCELKISLLLRGKGFVRMTGEYEFAFKSQVYQQSFTFDLTNLTSGLYIYQSVSCRSNFGNRAVRFCVQKSLTDDVISIPSEQMTIDAAIVQRDGSQLSGKEFNLSSPLNFDRVKIDFLKFSMKVPEGLLNPTITWMWAELKDIENISSFRIWKQESSTESEVTVKSADIKQAGDVIVAVRVRPSIEHSSIALDYEYMKFLRILNPLEMFRIECLVPHCEWTVKSHLMVYANPFSVVRVFCQQHGSPIQLEIPEQYKGSDTRKPDIMVQKTGTNALWMIYLFPLMLIRNTLSGLVTIQGKCGEHSDFQFQVRSLRRADDHLLYCEFDRKVVTALRDNLRLKCRSMYVKMTLRVSIFVHSGILMHPMIANELELLTTPVRKKLQTIDGIRIMDEHDILLSSMPIGDISMNYALKIIVSSLERPSIVRIYELISLPPNYNEIITYNRILCSGFEWKTVLQTIVLRVTSIVRAVEKLCVTKSTEYSSPCRSALAINDKLSAFLLKIKLDICNDKYTAEHLANLFSLMLNTPVTVGSATRFLINRYLMTIRSCEIRKMISTTLIQLSDNVRWYYAEANMARFERDMGGIYSNIADSDIDSTLSALGIANQLITELMINNTAFDGGRTFRVIRMRSSQFQSDVIAMVLRGFTRAELTRNPATFILFLNELVTLDRLDYGISKPKMIFALLGAESIRREYAGQKQTDKPLSKGMLMIRVPLEDPVVTPRFHNFYLCDHLHTLNMSFITNQYASHVTLRFGNLKLVRRITLQGKLTIGHHCFEIRNQFTNVSWYYFSSTINGTNSRSQIDSVTVEAKTNSKVCLIVKIAIEKSVPWISAFRPMSK
ncbi:hypothetical protein ACOME3_005193 [Neoechinorhynchus agilis]